MRKIIVIAALALLAAGCASSAPAAKPKPTPTAMTLLQACRVLRADMLANGGTADKATLARIARQARASAPKLAEQARFAEKAVGDSDAWQMDAAFLASYCQAAGVQIPTGA